VKYVHKHTHTPHMQIVFTSYEVSSHTYSCGQNEGSSHSDVHGQITGWSEVCSFKSTDCYGVLIHRKLLKYEYTI